MLQSAQGLSIWLGKNNLQWDSFYIRSHTTTERICCSGFLQKDYFYSKIKWSTASEEIKELVKEEDNNADIPSNFDQELS